MILHITTPENWHAALQQGIYRPASLETEGFIHCCLEQQLLGVVERYFTVPGTWVVLFIDEQKLDVPLRYEPSPVVPDLFPHIYGPLNPDAVQIIKPLVR